jgi:hypothetical protein
MRRVDHSSKGVLPSVLLSLRNLRCEATEVHTTTDCRATDDDDIVTNSRGFYFTMELYYTPKFNTQLLITVHNSSRILTHV